MGRSFGRVVVVSAAALTFSALSFFNVNTHTAHASASPVVFHCEAGITANDDTVCIDINTASMDALVALPGIGEVLAQRVIDARPLADIAALDAVKGFGPKTLAKVAPFVFFGQ